jgi:hypothetical protein
MEPLDYKKGWKLYFLRFTFAFLKNKNSRLARSVVNPEPYPHGSAPFYLEPHQIQKQDPDPHQSQTSGALEAEN